MVLSNQGYPDPENPSEDLSPSHEIIMVNDTDTDEEENPYNGYEPLPWNDVVESNEEEDDDDEVEEAPAVTDEALPPITRIEDALVREVWAGPAPKTVGIEMDNNKVNEVKQAMLNVTLPSTSIPEWANHIPEDQWKEKLLNRLQNMQGSDQA